MGKLSPRKVSLRGDVKKNKKILGWVPGKYGQFKPCPNLLYIVG